MIKTESREEIVKNMNVSKKQAMRETAKIRESLQYLTQHMDKKAIKDNGQGDFVRDIYLSRIAHIDATVATLLENAEQMDMGAFTHAVGEVRQIVNKCGKEINPRKRFDTEDK